MGDARHLWKRSLFTVYNAWIISNNDGIVKYINRIRGEEQFRNKYS